MREIKFRAWDTNTISSGWMIHWDDLKHHIINSFFESDKRSIMQFTGLKDKNNKEIYEGDIVISSRYDADDKFKTIIEDIRNIDPYGWMSGSNLNWNEVVGNIYENPELIK